MTTKKQDAATAGTGLAMVGTGGALRHAALVDAYREKTDHPVKRPRLWQEQRFLRTPHGRKKFAAAAALGVLGLPPAAVGTARLMHTDPVDKRDKLLDGVKESLQQRNEGIKDPAPAKLVLGNYLAGAAVGSGAGGLTHHLLGKTKLHNTSRAAAAASMAGVLAGSATLPVQAKLTERASHGHYTVTPTGVRRAKTKPVRPSSKATVIDGRQGNPGRMRSDFGKKDGEHLARLGAHWTTGLHRLADAVDRPTPAAAKKGRKFVATGRKAASGAFRELANNAAHLPKVAEPVLRHALAKADRDPGGSMTRNQRRALVTATAPPIPFVGDAMQSAQAARLSPEPYRRRTAVQNFTAGQAAGTTGNVLGALGAAKLAQSNKTFDRVATNASDKIDEAKAKVRSKVGLKPKGPSMTSRVLHHKSTPEGIKRAAGAIKESGAGRLIAHNPKVAGVGAIVGGAIGGHAGQQSMYTHVMNRDDRYRRNQGTQSRQGFGKRDAGTGMSRREELQQLKRKRHAAAISAGTNVASIGTLGLLGAAALPKMPHRGKLVRVATTTGTAVGGVSALNGVHQANMQRKELKAREQVLAPKTVSKVAPQKKHLEFWQGYGLKRMNNAARNHPRRQDMWWAAEAGRQRHKATGGRIRQFDLAPDSLYERQHGPVVKAFGMPRAPRMRRGFLRQTRTATGVRTMTVRGGLIR